MNEHNEDLKRLYQDIQRTKRRTNVVIAVIATVLFLAVTAGIYWFITWTGILWR